ncbi:MAG TPA: hypothetical protein P5548_00205 [Candidatus Moranbacteria bacterium]|nr:hypothetical protein [Candidatus Moranbacteria bacterium]HRZ33314.1 hypothetical protein [Candidatus Moranbacteria bacterium]
MKRLARLAATLAAFVVFQILLVIWIFHPETEAGHYLKLFAGCLITAIFSNGWGFWLEYGQATIYGAWSVLKVVVFAYLEIKEKESKRQIAAKTTKTATKWVAYFLSDWGVEIIIVSTIGALKYYNCSWNTMFLVAWALDVLVALTFIFISQNIVDDFILMAAYRRSFDALYEINKQAGGIFLGYSLIKFSLWDGSEVATMFFNRELNTTMKKVLAVMFFSAIRILLLVKIFNLGYDVLK